MSKLVVALFSIALIFCSLNAQAQKGREFYQITVYHFNNSEQERTIDEYLQKAYLPALHKKGIKQVGVFKSRTNDTVNDKRTFVFIPLKNIEEFANLTSKLVEDQEYLENGKVYLDAPYNNTPYARMENILLRAFPLAPKMNLPKLKSAKADRVYELRSYEGGTEKLFRNKVEMFNQGGEIKLFERLNFNAVFYGEVLAGSRMPNLMYMTTFENIADRDAHWKTFGQDAEWKTISALPQYQKNVSKSDIMLLTPTDYSDF